MLITSEVFAEVFSKVFAQSYLLLTRVCCLLNMEFHFYLVTVQASSCYLTLPGLHSPDKSSAFSLSAMTTVVPRANISESRENPAPQLRW